MALIANKPAANKGAMINLLFLQLVWSGVLIILLLIGSVFRVPRSGFRVNDSILVNSLIRSVFCVLRSAFRVSG
jgi:TM2 domain-containing membrane protein YozV